MLVLEDHLLLVSDTSQQMGWGSPEELWKEKGLLIVFTNTRESVGKFLEGKTFENAEKDFREARDRALSKANECPTSRQRDDAKRFLEKAADKSRRELENFNQYYSNFVDQFKGIFFGPISDSTYNELLEPSDWSNYQGGLESFSIQEKIKQIYNDSDKAWKVSLDGFTDQQKREFEDLLKKEMDRLKGIIEVAEGSIIRRVGEVIRLRVAFLRDYLK